MVVFFVNGDSVLKLSEANLENLLNVSASRLSIYNFFEQLDPSSGAYNFQ